MMIMMMHSSSWWFHTYLRFTPKRRFPTLLVEFVVRVAQPPIVWTPWKDMSTPIVEKQKTTQAALRSLGSTDRLELRRIQEKTIWKQPLWVSMMMSFVSKKVRVLE